MKKDELIQMWQRENDHLFGDEQIEKDMITKYLSEKAIKGNRNIHFNLAFYGTLQLANIILISMNLAGFLNNPAVIWILVSMLVFTIGTLVFGIDVFYKFREINNYSDSLQSLIQKQLWFYRRPYEIWLILSSVSAIILISNVNLFIDNDNGTYVIYNKVLFAGVTLASFIFIYGAQKLASLYGLRKLKVYLSDLQQGVLDQSKSMERLRRRYLWVWVLVFILLTAFLIFGILAALP